VPLQLALRQARGPSTALAEAVEGVMPVPGNAARLVDLLPGAVATWIGILTMAHPLDLRADRHPGLVTVVTGIVEIAAVIIVTVEILIMAAETRTEEAPRQPGLLLPGSKPPLPRQLTQVLFQVTVPMALLRE
jgi:hypothetical protein